MVGYHDCRLPPTGHQMIGSKSDFYGYVPGSIDLIDKFNEEFGTNLSFDGTYSTMPFGTYSFFESLGITAFFSVPLGLALAAECSCYLIIDKDAPFWRTGYRGFKITRDDIELEEGEVSPVDSAYLISEQEVGTEVFYRIDPYQRFVSSAGEVLEYQSLITPDDNGKTIPLTIEFIA